MSAPEVPPAAAAAAAKDAAAPTAATPDAPGDDANPSKKGAKKAAKAEQLAAKKAAKVAASQPKAAKAGGSKKPAKEPKPAQAKSVWIQGSGAKKDLSEPMDNAYDPLKVESHWYAWWEKSGFFAPREITEQDPYNKEETFVVPIPPPNVTGSLHIGHALTMSIQDTLCRWYRMQGKRVLYVPGFDHAGIATQAVVEKRLLKFDHLTRHDLGRDKFLERVFAWKDEYASMIGTQLRRLGSSYDWSREAFTMDDMRSRAVTEAFVRLFDQGIIYRANRIVNWSSYLTTSLSNLEVDQKELTGPTLLSLPGYGNEKIQFGVLFNFYYPIADAPDGAPQAERLLQIATTRPETILGDTAVAIHPDDPRHKHLHGKFVEHPFFPGRKLPIVLDPEAVDMEFGTGAVKITPAHDPNDFNVGVRHSLPFINILNDDGTLNENAGQFQNMKRLSARKAVIEALKEKKLYIDEQPNPMSVPICSRSGDVVEPVLKPQWWVKSKVLADEAVALAKKEGLTIRPEKSENEFYRWLDNILDWCISRQLWWGHRIPAYFFQLEGTESNELDSSNWIVARSSEEAQAEAEKRAGGKKFTLSQDEDVLDTWFSSGLWPFSLMGWPEQTPDMAHFYPNSLLETGRDIIYFWVARMVMLGANLTKTLPFHEIFCHGMVRDAHGRKMSKSLGNVIDPIDVIEGIDLPALHAKLENGNLDAKEVAKARIGQTKDFPKGIPQCGTDALRLALVAYTSANADINLDILRVEGYRKFCNKMWNATKFALLKLDGFTPASVAAAAKQASKADQSLVERWILAALQETIVTVNNSLAQRQFMDAVNAAYAFWLYDFCDVYIEAIKPVTDHPGATVAGSPEAAAKASAQETLYTVLDQGLKLLHPFMPFVTEELWQRLPRRAGDEAPTIALTSYPSESAHAEWKDDDAKRNFTLLFDSVKTLRGVAMQYGLIKDLEMWLETTSPNVGEVLRAERSTIETLIKGCRSIDVLTGSLETTAAAIPPGCAVASVQAGLRAHLLVRGRIDVAAEVAKLDKKLALANGNIDRLTKQINRTDTWDKTPPQAKAQVETSLKNYASDRQALIDAKASFEQFREA